MEIVIGMLFLAFNNGNFQCFAEKLTWRFYIIVEILPIISWVKLINKKKFAKLALNENSKTFMVYMVALKVGVSIYLSETAQIAFLK